MVIDKNMILKAFRTRDIVLILALIFLLLFSPYLKGIRIQIPPLQIPPLNIPSLNNDHNEPQTNTSVNEPQTYVQDTGTQRDIGICGWACVDFCNANPNVSFIPWHEIVPHGSTKNCKTILEEELGVADLSTCKQCKCVCLQGQNTTVE